MRSGGNVAAVLAVTALVLTSCGEDEAVSERESVLRSHIAEWEDNERNVHPYDFCADIEAFGGIDEFVEVEVGAESVRADGVDVSIASKPDPTTLEAVRNVYDEECQ